MKETLIDIGLAIKNHRMMERSSFADCFAVGRAYCDHNGEEQQVWICPGTPDDNWQERILGFGSQVVTPTKVKNGPLETDGHVVYIDTKLYQQRFRHCGTVQYRIKPKGKAVTDHTLTVLDKATYRLNQRNSDVSEIHIEYDEGRKFSNFQELNDLIGQLDSLTKKRESEQVIKEQLRTEQEAAAAREKSAREEAEKARKEEELAKKRRNEEERAKAERACKEAEEQARKEKEEAERRQREIQKREEGIAKLDADLQNTQNLIKETHSWIRKEMTLRTEHFIDDSQDEAKRGHLYDGVPLVIDGGPGTGKTTTLVQRLKFLISRQALIDYAMEDGTLNQKQIDWIADPQTRDSNWLFFSPTPQLLRYLRDNMKDNNLKTTPSNTTVLEDFRKRMMREYKLTNPDTYKPFRNCRGADNQKTLIFDPLWYIEEFETYCVLNIASILTQTAKIKTSDYSWHQLAVEIKYYCYKASSITDFDALMRLFNSLHDNEFTKVKQIKLQFDSVLKTAAYFAQEEIVKEESCKKELMELFARWRKEAINTDAEEALEDEQEEDEEEEEEQAFDSAAFETKLFTELRKLLKQLSLKPYSTKIALSKRLREFYGIVKPIVEGVDLHEVGELYWFIRKFADLCKGIESNILNQIPRLYKTFRANLIKELSFDRFDHDLMLDMVTKDGNCRLHHDEENLLIGFINNLLLGIYRKSKTRFDAMKKQKYISAYRQNVKPVIGVDEATDYSLLDYYFIASFRHYEKSSITLCGDIMQALNDNGIKNWKQLDHDYLLKGLQVHELNVSYRQLPTLVDMSRQMYFDDLGIEAPYHSLKERYEREPAPLVMAHDDEDTRIDWIARHIVEVYKAYNYDMPSVAIFVSDKLDIRKFIRKIIDSDILNNIKIVEGEEAIDEACVRVFRLSEVKGMEFEVVFFYNIDEALGDHNENLMRRYLYVGISRATTHLAATFTQRDGYENIIQYFDESADSWLIE